MKNKLNTCITIKEMQELSKKAKAAILTMTTLANSGHPGGSMSSLDLLIALYHSINLNPQDPNMNERDRVIVSHGHISPAVYSTLAYRGYFDIVDVITQFRLAGSIFEGHIETEVPGVEWTSGNLGQGLSAATGFALSSKILQINNQIYCIMGDGEQQKGQISEARRFAIKYGLNNITAIIDYNKIQICGDINIVMPQNIKANYESDGWKTIEINGHDYKEIFSAIEEAHKLDAPVLILAHTKMGNGVSFMENQEKYHGAALTEDDLFKAFNEIGFSFPYVEYKEKRQVLRGNIRKPYIVEEPPLYNFITLSKRLYEKDTDNRTAWGDALSDIARVNDDEKKNIAVFDCDLKSSVKTSSFEVQKPDRFFQAGIAEHHTVVASGALSRTGIQTFFANFGVFGIEETYNQHRLNDINQTNLKVILTHVGLDVGEDGKTHQCINYIGLANSLFNTRLIIPADPNQTYKIINFVVNQPGNYIIAMGRSKIGIIKNNYGEIFYGPNYVYEYGKTDILREGSQACMFVTGTLVNEAIKVVDDLKMDFIDLRLIYTSSPLEIKTETIVAAAKTGYIFTLEDHNIYTGIGSMIANRLVEEQVVCPLEKFAVNHYGSSGSAEDVYRSMHLDFKNLTLKIKKILGKWR